MIALDFLKYASVIQLGLKLGFSGLLVDKSSVSTSFFEQNWRENSKWNREKESKKVRVWRDEKNETKLRANWEKIQKISRIYVKENIQSGKSKKKNKIEPISALN